MSASLVGSEMCIRDRERPDVIDLSSPVMCPRLRACARCPPNRPGCDAPVSYTHLTLPTICSV
eukprot:6094686-Alexandrium_andersonii.AAC.1